MKSNSRTARILKVVCVRDTRAFTERADGAFIPESGTGENARCWRCRRGHEVYASVVVEGEREVLIGTDCVRRSDGELGIRVTTLSAAVTRLRSLTSRLARSNWLRAKWDSAWSQICMIPEPEFTLHSDGGSLLWEAEGAVVAIGKGTVTPTDAKGRQELQEGCARALHAWRMNQLRHYRMPLARPAAPSTLAEEIARVERHIETLQR